MDLTERIKAINLGMALQQRVGGKTADIYCGDEYYAAFLIDALGKLNIKAQCETYTVDGEYFVEVKF